MEMVTRCYRYALDPSLAQRAAIEKAARTARRYWNALVAAQRYAEREIDHGRRGSIASSLETILLGKSVTGAAAAMARKRAEEDGISIEEAAKLNRIEKARKSAAMIYSKKGQLLRRRSSRQLAVAYALESVELTRKKKNTAPSQVANALSNKFGDACALYVEGKRGAPKFKRREDSATLQYQHHDGKGAPYPIVDETFVRLHRLAGEVCARTRMIFHRPIPKGALIKQVALTIRAERCFVVFMLDLPASCVRQFVLTGGIAGIDPGRRTALAVSNIDGSKQENIQPAVARDRNFLKRQNRLQRKLARQLQKGNPDCFKADGTFKRGFRPKNKSAAYRETEKKLLRMSEHIANARLDLYHNAANSLLNQYDLIGIGKWRGKSAPGVGRSKRAQRRKDYDNAVSMFAGILRYKANGSKQIVDVPEHGTTKTCSDCSAESGPTGLAGLGVREWTCNECGSTHKRDFHSAKAIAVRAKKIAADCAVSVASPKGRKKGQRAKAQTKVLQRCKDVPVADQRDARESAPTNTPRAASAAVVTQAKPVGGRDSNVAAVGKSHQPAVEADDRAQSARCRAATTSSTPPVRRSSCRSS